MRHLLPATLLLALIGCATSPAGDNLAAYPAALVGAYDNSAQFAQAPDDMKRPPATPGDDWLDLQRVTFTAVSAPAVAPVGVYVEWRDTKRDIDRRRLWSFFRDADGVKLRILTLSESAPPITAQNPAAFAALTGGDVSATDPACDLRVSSNGAGAWNAQTDPEFCRLDDAALDIRITVMPTGVLYQEQARREDSSYALRFPGPAPYDLRRRP